MESGGGAGGAKGVEMVAGAAPDKYTALRAANPELTITPWLQPKVSYVASRDFLPGPATIAALGGEVTFALVGAPPALPHIAVNKLMALAVTQTKRTPLLPNIPTLDEALGVMGD